MASLKDFEKIIREKIKILDSTPAKFSSGVERVQASALREVLSLVKNLKVADDGKIYATKANMTVIGKIDQRLRELLGTDYVPVVSLVTDAIDETAKLNRDYFKGMFDVSKPLNGDRILENSRGAAFEQLLSDPALEASFYRPIREVLVNAVNVGATWGDIVQQLNLVITGDGKVDGRLLRYTKQIASDLVAVSDRTYSTALAITAKAEWFRYQGGLIEDSRPFCIERNGGYYHKDEVESWANETWAGQYRGTNAQNIFQWAGGYNCRHVLVPVSEIYVPDKWKQRAISLGYAV